MLFVKEIQCIYFFLTPILNLKKNKNVPYFRISSSEVSGRDSDVPINIQCFSVRVNKKKLKLKLKFAHDFVCFYDFFTWL